jgi:two-component system, chemotaxis family, CheB/CheR fusion protein
MNSSVSLPTPIVGVGASAGGVEALEGFFRGIPANPGFGIVVVTHLNPARESHLHQIVAQYTKLIVEVARDDVEVQPDSVYVLPADAVLGIAGGRLKLRTPDPGRRERKPIDIFLSALAIDLGEYSAGVILSGSDGDGTLGVKAIKERGGLTMAQAANGSGPRYPDMPGSAISSGFIDFAVPAEEMGAKLVQFARGLEELEATSDADSEAARSEEESR